MQEKGLIYMKQIIPEIFNSPVFMLTWLFGLKCERMCWLETLDPVYEVEADLCFGTYFLDRTEDNGKILPHQPENQESSRASSSPDMKATEVFLTSSSGKLSRRETVEDWASDTAEDSDDKQRFPRQQYWEQRAEEARKAKEEYLKCRPQRCAAREKSGHLS